jgi:hypothetical protein
MVNDTPSQHAVMIDANLKKHWQNKRRLRFAIALVILFLIVGGFFYWTETLVKRNKEKKALEASQEQARQMALVPTLFSKDDYRVENRADGKYIVVDKVGLTCKVPTGWSVEMIKDPFRDKDEYFANISSPDIERKNNLISKGCGIDLTIGTNIEGNQNAKQKIKMLQNNSMDKTSLGANIHYEIASIGEYKIVKSQDENLKEFGESRGIIAPIDDKLLITFHTFLPNTNRTACLQIWEKFVQNIVLK